MIKYNNYYGDTEQRSCGAALWVAFIMKRSLSYKIALGGTLASMCLVFQFATGVFPVLYIIMPMVCGILVTVMTSETNTRWGFLMYLAVSLLSLFITPNKEAALLFIMFFGHYPLWRNAVSRIEPKFLSFAVKLFFFNVCIFLYLALTVLLFDADELLDEMGDFKKYGGIFLLCTVNVMFSSYDYLMSLAQEFYKKKLHPILTGKSK